MTIRRSAARARRAASTRRRELYGDEQEWQARLRAAGGRIRYVAAAALDHRRAGDDARLRALCARRLPPRAGEPALRRLQGHARRRWRAELRVLAGCAAARPALRLRERPGADRPPARAPAGRCSAPPGAARRRRRASTTSSPARAAPPAGAAAQLARLRDLVADVRDAPRRARAGRAARAARRRAGACSCSASSGPASLMAAAARELQRSRHDVDVRTVPMGAARQVREPQRAARRHRPGRLRLAARASTTTSSLPRGFLDALPGRAPRARGLHARPARAPPALARRLGGHAPPPGSAVRETTLRRDRPGDRVRPRRRSTTLLPFPAQLRMGWGLDAHWARARRASAAGGSGSSTPRRSPTRSARPATATPREAAVAEARAFLADRPYVPRDEVRTLAVAPDEGRGRRRVLPARRRPGARRLGAPPGDRRARRRRRRARARAAPPGPAARDARRATRRGALRTLPPSRATPTLDGIEVDVRAVPRPAARRAPTARWGAWAAPPLALALRRLRAAFASTSSTPTTRCPPATPCCARGSARRSSSPSTAATSSTPPRATPAARAAVRRAFGAARLVLANRAASRRAARDLGARAHPRRAPRHRPARARRATRRARRRSSPSATSSPASATPTSCARCGCCATATRELRYLVIGDGPERAALERARRASSALADRVEFAGQLPPERGAGPRAPRRTCSRCPRSTRPSASPTSRRWPPAARRSAPRGEPGPGGDRAPPATGMLLVAAGRRRGARRASSTRCSATPTCASASARARARPSARAFTWEPCGARDGRGLRGRAAVKPVLFVTNHVPPDRAGAFAALHARVPLELALFGGRSHHATAGVADPGVPHRHVAQREVRALAASRRATAPSSAAPPGASRCPRPGAARARARRPVRPLERAVGAPAHARAPRSRAPLSAPHLPRAPTASSPTARTSPPTPARCGARHVARRAAGRRQRVLVGAAPACAATTASARCSSGARRRRRGSPMPRWRPGRGPALARGAARLRIVGAGAPVGVRSRPSSCATPTPAADVLVIPSIAARALPRAVGPRRQRGHEPALRHHRHRRRRRRRRRARAPRAQRARRPGRRPRRAGRRAARACTTTPPCARGLGDHGARATSPPTPTRPGPTASRRRCATRPRRRGLASLE